MNLESEESWSNARRYAALLLPVPSSVQGAVTALWNNHVMNYLEGINTLDESCLRHVKLLDKSNVLKAPLYFAAVELFPERLDEYTEDDTAKALAHLLGPGMFSALVGLVYLHRRVNKLCATKDWSSVAGELELNLELGFKLGRSIPNIGESFGVLTAVIRFLSLCCFHMHDPERTRRYRNIAKGSFDIEYEREHWGCDHAQIAAYILNQTGFGKDFMKNTCVLRSARIDPRQGESPYHVWKSFLTVLDDLRDGTQEDAVFTEALSVLKVDESTLADLRAIAQEISTRGPRFTFLKKGVRDKEN